MAKKKSRIKVRRNGRGGPRVGAGRPKGSGTKPPEEVRRHRVAFMMTDAELDAVESLADEFSLSDADRREMNASGGQAVFTNRVGWANTYLKQARLLEGPRRGYLKITQRGKDVLAENFPRIDSSVLERFPEFVEFRAKRKSRRKDATATSSSRASDETPEDALSNAYQTLRVELEAQLLEEIANALPAFFERLVVDVLVEGGIRR